MRTSLNCATIALIAGTSLAAARVSAAPTRADEVMGQVRQASKVMKAGIPAAGIMLTGTGTVAGLPTEYTVVFDSAGHFAQTSSGRVSVAMGFDGSNAWSMDIGGERRVLELSDRKQMLFAGLVMTGLWMDENSGITFTPHMDVAADGEGSRHTTILDFSHAATGITGTVAIDADTWMAKEWKYRGETAAATIAMSGEIEYNGMKFPGRIVRSTKNGVEDEILFAKAREAPSFLVSPYAANLQAPGDVVFDSSIPAEIEVKRAPTGHLLVHPLVNGKDVGWFIFDSGAGSNVLNTRAVKELELETFGTLPAVGVGGTVMTSWSRPATLSLGRVTLKEPLVVGLDLSFLDGPMGAPIAGIIGYGLFHRSVAEVDMKLGTIALFDPANYDEARVNNKWAKLHLDARVACVEASFEGHAGIFKLDTGAAGSTVSLHGPAVKRLKLLEGRETTDTREGGVGGMVAARKGILQWFELGGNRTENVTATFAIEDKGAYASTETLGNIGGKLLEPFRIVFDYQHGRIGFVKR